MLVTSIFSFSHNVFYSLKGMNHHFNCLNCRLQMFSIWTSLKFGRLAKGWSVPIMQTPHADIFTFNLTCQLWALPFQQQIKIWCHKYWHMGDTILRVSRKHCGKRRKGKEEIAILDQFLLCPQCFPKLSVVDALKWISVEKRLNSLPNNKILQPVQIESICRQQFECCSFGAILLR